MNDEQLSSSVIRTVIVLLCFEAILACVGLPVVTFLPALTHIKLTKTISLEDVMTFLGGASFFTIIFILNYSKYRRAWRSEPLRWWKIAFWIGLVLAPIGYIAVNILVPFAQDGDTTAIVLILISFAIIIIGMGLLTAGAINVLTTMSLLIRRDRAAKSVQQDTAPDAPQ
jgi:hypothetical protein